MKKIYYTLLALSLATTPLAARPSKRKQKRQHNKSLIKTIAQNKIVWGAITLLALGGGALYLKKTLQMIQTTPRLYSTLAKKSPSSDCTIPTYQMPCYNKLA